MSPQVGLPWPGRELHLQGGHEVADAGADAAARSSEHAVYGLQPSGALLLTHTADSRWR